MTDRVCKEQKKIKGKHTGKVLLSSLAALGAVTPFFPDLVAATATLPIYARLIQAIEVTVEASLNFGTLAMTIDRTGEAKIDPIINKLIVSSRGGLSLAGGDPEAGRLQIRGANLPVSISVEDTNVQLTNGTTSVVVDNFVFNTADGAHKVTVTPTGTHFAATLAVGATINTRVGQPVGNYVGVTRISANYQ